MSYDPTSGEIEVVAKRVAAILKDNRLTGCLMGSAASALWGTSRMPNDVDMVVMSSGTQSEEDIKRLIVDEEPTSFLVPSTNPRNTYKILWFRVPGRIGVSCKVDILVPPSLMIPPIAAEHIVWVRDVPIMPIVPLLLMKLQGWADHNLASRPDLRAKAKVDVEDIKELLVIAVGHGRTLQDEACALPSSFSSAGEVRVGVFSFLFPDTEAQWRALGFLQTPAVAAEDPADQVSPERAAPEPKPKADVHHHVHHRHIHVTRFAFGVHHHRPTRVLFVSRVPTISSSVGQQRPGITPLRASSTRALLAHPARRQSIAKKSPRGAPRSKMQAHKPPRAHGQLSTRQKPPTIRSSASKTKARNPPSTVSRKPVTKAQPAVAKPPQKTSSRGAPRPPATKPVQAKRAPSAKPQPSKPPQTTTRGAGKAQRNAPKAPPAANRSHSTGRRPSSQKAQPASAPKPQPANRAPATTAQSAAPPRRPQAKAPPAARAKPAAKAAPRPAHKAPAARAPRTGRALSSKKK